MTETNYDPICFAVDSADIFAGVTADDDATRARVWSFGQRKLLAEFDTIDASFGPRLCLVAGGKVAVAGSWEDGVVAYDVPSGRVRWKSPRLPEVDAVVAVGAGLVAVCLSERQTHVLNADTGKIVGKLPNVTFLKATLEGKHGVASDGASIAFVNLEDGSGFKSRFGGGFGVLDASIHLDRVLVSEADGPVRCFDVARRKELWKCRPKGAGAHAKSVEWCDDLGAWFALLWSTAGGDSAIVTISADGKALGSVAIGRKDGRFMPGGRHLVTTDGEVRATSDGDIAWRLA